MAGVDRDLDVLARLDIAAARAHARGQRLGANVEVDKDLAAHTLDDFDLAADLGQTLTAGKANVFNVLGPHAHDDLLTSGCPGLGENPVFDRNLEPLAGRHGLTVAADLDGQEVHGRAPDDAGDARLARAFMSC